MSRITIKILEELVECINEQRKTIKYEVNGFYLQSNGNLYTLKKKTSINGSTTNISDYNLTNKEMYQFLKGYLKGIEK